jgi:hypothetical protein
MTQFPPIKKHKKPVSSSKKGVSSRQKGVSSWLLRKMENVGLSLKWYFKMNHKFDYYEKLCSRWFSLFADELKQLGPAN